MPSTRLQRTKQKYGASAVDASCLSVLTALFKLTTTHQSQVIDLFENGVSWIQIFQIICAYGPYILSVVQTIEADVQSAGGLTLAAINQILAQYAIPGEQMMLQLLTMLGIVWPTA